MPHSTKRNRLVIARDLLGSDHPTTSRYSGYLVDDLMHCDSCNLVGISFRTPTLKQEWRHQMNTYTEELQAALNAWDNNSESIEEEIMIVEAARLVADPNYEAAGEALRDGNPSTAFEYDTDEHEWITDELPKAF